jgi:type VI secretion system protein ImpM
MGVSLKQQNTTVGMYGKLPTARDFLRVNAGSDEVRNLDEWLSGALAAAQRLVPNWESTYASSGLISFIISQPETSGRCLVGAMVPSKDANGRLYPLVIFSEVDEALLVQSYPSIPGQRFLLDLEQLLSRRRRVHHEKVAAAVQRLQPPGVESLEIAEQEYERYLERTTCGSAFGTMFSGDGVNQGAVALQTLHAFCQELWPGRPLPSWGLRCPLGGFPAGTAALWLALVKQSMPQPLIPSVIWSRNTLLIYFNRLSTKALTALWHIGWHDETLCDLASTRAERQPSPIDPELPLRSLFVPRR